MTDDGGATVRGVVRLVRDAEITFLAAAIAYYAFVSLLPAVLLALAAASAVGGDRLVAQVLAGSQAYLTPAGQDLLGSAIGGDRGRSGATVVGLAVLGWSSIRVFRGLDVAFSRVYGTESAVTFVGQIQNAVVVALGIGAGIAGMILVGALLAVLDPRVGREVLGFALLLAGLFVVFLPLYYVFPGREVTVREVVPGTALAAVGWVVLQASFQVYAAAAPRFQLYGVIGGVLLLVTWFYASSILLLVGAVVNAVLGDRRRDGRNRQGQGSRPRHGLTTAMDGTDPDDDRDSDDVQELRRELDALETDIEERTVHRSEIEADLKRYVRARMRRGHARGWGPYVVLLYGTAMTLGAFFLLSGVWAILAMVVVWLSTLGLYVMMLLVGAGLSALSVPRRAIDMVRDRFL